VGDPVAVAVIPAPHLPQQGRRRHLGQTSNAAGMCYLVLFLVVMVATVPL